MDLKRYGLHRRRLGGLPLTIFELGKVYSLNLVSQDEMLAFVDSYSMRDEDQVLLLSRLPQRRLLEHVDIDKVSSYWVTSQQVTGAIQPSLAEILDLVSSHAENGTGLAVVEGIEWLISIHGFDEVLKMALKLKDSISNKKWAVLFVVTDGIMDAIQQTQWHREVLEWEIPHKVELSELSDIPSEDGIEIEDSEILLTVDRSSELSFLVKISREGYSKDVVRRRILQWRRMGLDVSEAEPALFQESDSDGYKIYRVVEEKVRRAIELDNRLDILLEMGWRSEVTKMRFRIRQLTGFSEVESRINELI